MGSINSSVGLISGIDTASLIDSLIALESRGKINLQTQLANLQSQQTAMLDVNARLLNLKNVAQTFRLQNLFRAANATSGNEETILATASTGAQPGSFSFIVKQLVSTSQKLTQGYADRDTTPLNLSSLSFELGKGGLATDTDLTDLNGGLGVARGTIDIQDRSGDTATIDLTDVTTLQEAIDRINDNEDVSVTASVDGDRLLITDTSGGSANNLTVADGSGYTTATDLGIAGDGGGTGQITGTVVNVLGGGTSLRSLNDGNGVLVRNNVTDFTIQTHEGTTFEIDLGRIDADIELTTKLEDLNNGAGITLNDSTDDPDLIITDRDGVAHEVDLTGVTTVTGLQDRIKSETGDRIELQINADKDGFDIVDIVDTGGGLLKVTGAGPNGTDTAEDLGILEEDGVAAATINGSVVPNAVSLGRVATLQDVIDRINNAKDTTGSDNLGRIVASIAADGVSLQIDDATVGANNLIIRSTSVNPTAAADLGIETDALGTADTTVDGSRLIAGLNSVLVSNLNGGAGLSLPSLGDPAPLTSSTLLVDLFNGSGLDTNGDPGDYDVRFRDRDGTNHDVEFDGLTTVQDLIDAVAATSGGLVTASIEGQSLRFSDNTGGTGDFRIQDRNGSNAADQLGIEINDPVDSVLSTDTLPVYTAASFQLQITNRLGTTTGVGLTGAESVQDIINLINQAGAGVTASLNRAGNGLAITDTSGGTGNLTIAGAPADSLGITADVAADRVDGSNLQHRYVSESTALEDLNYGRGVSTGSFRITDGLGNSDEVNLGSNVSTLYDIIAVINSRGLAVQARINDNGDGLLIEHDLEVGQTAVSAIKVESTGGGTAGELNILGTADDVDSSIDGSYERQIDVTISDSLDDVVEKINDAGIPVAAAVIDTGAGAQRYRLNLTSDISGSVGELYVDTGGVDLGLTTLSTGEDAKVFFGSPNPATALLLRSPTNTLTGVVPGLTLDLLKADDEPVTVTVTRDTEAIETAVNDLVDAFNTVLSTIEQYDFYDSDTERRGILLGSSLTERVRQSLYRTAQRRAEGVGSSLQFLSEVGIRLGSGGKLEIDMEKFREVYASDPDAVENLFAAFESTTDSTREIAPGITVQETNNTVTSRGFGDLFADLADGLTDSVSGTITVYNDGLDDRIKLLNQRIEQFDERLEARRGRLQAEFTAMELALARLQGQSSALSSLGANVAQAQSQARGIQL